MPSSRYELAALGVLLSGSALAAPVSSGEPITAGVAGLCPLLASDVVLNLSKSVKATYVCGAEVIGLAACHPAGRRALVLLDGAPSTTGVVYITRSDGGTVGELAGCPLGDNEIPDEMVQIGEP